MLENVKNMTRMRIPAVKATVSKHAGVVDCRRTDKQSATVPDEDEADGDLTDIAMGEALMLDQEPDPEYDVDDEQRPRVSRVCQSLLH